MYASGLSISNFRPDMLFCWPGIICETSNDGRRSSEFGFHESACQLSLSLLPGTRSMNRFRLSTGMRLFNVQAHTLHEKNAVCGGRDSRAGALFPRTFPFAGLSGIIPFLDRYLVWPPIATIFCLRLNNSILFFPPISSLLFLQPTHIGVTSSYAVNQSLPGRDMSSI